MRKSQQYTAALALVLAAAPDDGWQRCSLEI
jgi:hypothetical protein